MAVFLTPSEAANERKIVNRIYEQHNEVRRRLGSYDITPVSDLETIAETAYCPQNHYDHPDTTRLHHGKLQFSRIIDVRELVNCKAFLVLLMSFSFYH